MRTADRCPASLRPIDPRERPWIDGEEGGKILELSSGGYNAIDLVLSRNLDALLSVARAQQSPAPTGDTIGHPPPLPGPPPISEPSTAQPAPKAAAPKPDEPAVKGYTGAYAPAGTPSNPYYNGPLPTYSAGPGLNVVGPDGNTRTVKAVPCTLAARETDGSTTCVGIPDQSRTKRRR